MRLFEKQCQRCILLYGKIAINPDIICKGKEKFAVVLQWPDIRFRLETCRAVARRRGEPDRRDEADRPGLSGSKDGQMKQAELNNQVLTVGIDIGSTTTKIVALSADGGETLFSDYRRHGAAQAKSVARALKLLWGKFPQAQIRLAITGSGGKGVAALLGVPYIQEVVANSIALRQQYAHVRTAIELGGQDAKMIFFKPNTGSGALEVADTRMNGSCAGGTGAFIDEVASILKVPIEEFDALAAQGTCVYDISGRCGVYAKTDIQPLLNQGVAKADLALSAFHAIAKQTIGGLAQGLDIEKPVVFEGGPLTFNKTLVKVFAQRLSLTEKETLIPPQPELMIARGTALSLNSLFAGQTEPLAIGELAARPGGQRGGRGFCAALLQG